MWRGAHGRLAAIAMLAGGLSGCATTPKPVQDDEREEHHAQLRSGRVVCSGDARNRWPGLYRAIAGGADRLCAVTVEGRVKCDREWPASAKSRTP